MEPAQDVQVEPGEKAPIPVPADGHLTLLQFLRCLPGSSWLRGSILWADDLAAIWPKTEPTPHSAEEQQSLEEILQLRGEHLFEPQWVFEGEMLQLEDVVRELKLVGPGRPASEQWRDGELAVGPRPIGPADDSTIVDDPDVYLNYDKLSDPVRLELTRQKLLEPLPDDRGYIAADVGILDRLLGGYACALQASSHGRMLPDVTEPEQARRLAAPWNGGEGIRQAIIVAVRKAASPNLKTNFKEFIDFRLDQNNERARRDYIEQLIELWKLCSDGAVDHRWGQVAEKVSADLNKASLSYIDRVGKKGLSIGGMSFAAAVIPLFVPHLAVLNLIGGVAGGGAAVAAVSVRNGAPRFVRSASDANLFATRAKV